MISSIQVLRGIAALLVVVVHSEDLMYRYFQISESMEFGKQLFDDGRCGVDLFFVISGFIMTYTMHLKPKKWSDFLANRAIRIIPLYWFLTCLLAILLYTFPEIFSNITLNYQQLFYSLFFIPNEFQPLIRIGWTLNYEVFFYLIFSISLILPKKIGVFTIWIVIGVLVLIGYSIEFTNPILKHITFPLLLEFLAGSIIARVWLLCRCESRYSYFIIALGVLFIVVPLDGGRVVDWGVGCSILFIGFLFLPSESFLSSNKVLVYIGRISYSLYLSHDFVVPAIGKFWFKFDLNETLPMVTMPLVCILLSIPIAGIVYKYIEVPGSNMFRKAWNEMRQRTG